MRKRKRRRRIKKTSTHCRQLWFYIQVLLSYNANGLFWCCRLRGDDRRKLSCNPFMERRRDSRWFDSGGVLVFTDTWRECYVNRSWWNDRWSRERLGHWRERCNNRWRKCNWCWCFVNCTMHINDRRRSIDDLHPERRWLSEWWLEKEQENDFKDTIFCLTGFGVCAIGVAGGFAGMRFSTELRFLERLLFYKSLKLDGEEKKNFEPMKRAKMQQGSLWPCALLRVAPFASTPNLHAFCESLASCSASNVGC